MPPREKTRRCNSFKKCGSAKVNQIPMKKVLAGAENTKSNICSSTITRYHASHCNSHVSHSIKPFDVPPMWNLFLFLWNQLDRGLVLMFLLRCSKNVPSFMSMSLLFPSMINILPLFLLLFPSTAVWDINVPCKIHKTRRQTASTEGLPNIQNNTDSFLQHSAKKALTHN